MSFSSDGTNVILEPPAEDSFIEDYHILFNSEDEINLQLKIMEFTAANKESLVDYGEEELEKLINIYGIAKEPNYPMPIIDADAIRDEWNNFKAIVLANYDKLSTDDFFLLLFQYHSDMNSGNGSNKWRTGLITTYVATLPQSSRDVLSQAGIKISRMSSKPTFDYACFLKGLHICSLEVHVIFWILLITGIVVEHGRVIVINPLLRKRIFIVIHELMKNFFRKSKVLYNLNAGSGIIVPEILANVIIEIPEAKQVLSKLRTFTCGSTVNTAKFMSKIVSVLSNYSRNIQQLEVHPYEDLNELSKLISVQKFLSSISMEENHTSGKIRKISWKTSNSAPFEIMKKAYFITRLTIGRMYFPVEELANFVNLEELFLSAFGDQDYPRSKWIQLTGVSLKKLKIFYFCSINSIIYLDIFANFIKNCGKLQQVIIHSHKLFDPNNSGLLIANIAQFCPDIILYEGPILQDNRREFTKLLDSCNHLRSLHLRPSKGIPGAFNQESSSTNQRNSEGKVDFDAILKEITENQPQNLRNLRISDGWMISAEAFEKFLESREEMSRPVCFYWNPTVQFKGQMEEVCKTYHRYGVLKQYVSHVFY
ncbi:13859_t:CDS:2 [Funneliformis geosporum]|uniref:13859_t:CDS:1 n=1 Tax=Funneliformis geosporum TaxID=1117311 RepID=A0A9W4WLG6_9GLOM|nr:13859_t:CDS:2 [Funneliformis geosporum]